MKKSFNFAQNAMLKTDVVKQFSEYKKVQEKQDTKKLNWAALVDSAFDYPVQNDAPYLSQGINCYPADKFQDLKNAAPWLVPIEGNDDLLKRIIRHCSERPMLSMIASYEPIDKLKQMWENLHWVSDVDNQPMMLRIADTRILPSLPAILNPAQWAALTSSIAHWLYINREGQLNALALAPKTVKADEKIKLTQAQLNEFLTAAEPDALIDFLVDNMPDVMPANLKGSAIYELIKQSCKIAHTYKVEAFNDRVSLAVAACLTLGDSNQNPKLEKILTLKKWEHGKLGEMLSAEEVV